MASTNATTAIITGGSRGLRRNTTVNLARRGVDIVFTYHSNVAEAQNLVREVESMSRKAAAFQLDTSNVKAFDAFREELDRTLRGWGRERFDYLVNNAGTSLHKPFEQTTEAEFDQIVNVHFKGVYSLTQKLLPLMNDGGRIVNISSGLARFSLPGISAYGAAKGAIEVLTRYLANELGPRGITANVVAPGAIETDFSGMVRDNSEMKKRVAEMTALGRAGVPDDIGPMIAALLSDDNRWVNGHRIEVSGGMSLGGVLQPEWSNGATPAGIYADLVSPAPLAALPHLGRSTALTRGDTSRRAIGSGTHSSDYQPNGLSL